MSLQRQNMEQIQNWLLFKSNNWYIRFYNWKVVQTSNLPFFIRLDMSQYLLLF